MQLNESYAKHKVNLLINHYADKRGIDLSKLLIKVELSDRMRTRGGYASKSKKRGYGIVLNKRLLNKNPSYIDQTIAHETAHIIDHYVFNGWGHGKTWKSVMSYLGFKSDRCHQMNTSGLKRKHRDKAIFICECSTHRVKTKRFERIMMYGATCRKCESKVKLLKTLY